METHGHIPNGLWVLHKCDNRSCVNVGHLFLGTARDNIQDCLAKNRRNTPRGESHWRTVLTERDVVEIRRLKGRLLQKEIARRFGVSDVVVSQLYSGKSWGHVS